LTTNSRKVRYGWKLEHGKVVPDQPAQKVIKQIIEDHSKGMSFAMIAEDLNKRGIPTARGGTWRGNTVGTIIEANETKFPAPPPSAPTRPLLPLPSQEAAIEAALAKDPNATSFEWVEYKWDEEAGEYKPEWQTLNIERTRREAEHLRVQAEALRNLTVAEKAKAFSFHEPVWQGFGSSDGLFGGNGIDQIVVEMTRHKGHEIHKLIDGLKDQQATKALLRKLANLLCRQITIQRQENLSLRQQLAEKEERLWELRNARSTIQSAPAPASTTQTGAPPEGVL
jgi:hypothetical protein